MKEWYESVWAINEIGWCLMRMKFYQTVLVDVTVPYKENWIYIINNYHKVQITMRGRSSNKRVSSEQCEFHSPGPGGRELYSCLTLWNITLHIFVPILFGGKLEVQEWTISVHWISIMLWCFVELFKAASGLWFRKFARIV